MSDYWKDAPEWANWAYTYLDEVIYSETEPHAVCGSKLEQRPKTRGKKDSLINRKLDWSLLLHDLRHELKLVAEVLHFAAYDKENPYGPRNWLGGGPEFIYELKNAIERHRTAISEGEYLDPESGKPHRAHIICSELFLLHFEELQRK